MEQLETTLWCPSCERDKPDVEFPHNHKSPARRRGRDYKCRKCKADYYLANKARMSAQTRAANIMRRYGISPDEYDTLIAAGCSTCSRQFTTARSVVLDHCHETGVVRGPLCHRCNVLLGSAADDATLLRRLADYLEQHATL